MEVKKLTSLIIEPTNICNLNCTICPTNNGMKREKGYMSFELFQKTIDGGKFLEHLCLHNWGEPLLNKDLFDMIKYAHDKGISYTVFNTNGTLLDDETVDQVLESPLSILRISVDGNPDTYRKIRGIDFKEIERNILNLIRKRDKANSPLEIGFIIVVDEETEKDIDSLCNKWKGLVDHIRCQPKLIHSKRTDSCPELFGKDYGKMVISWDGSVLPCCVDTEGKLLLGNVLNETVDSIWNGIAIKRLRNKHLNKDYPDICVNCNEYESQKAEKRFTVSSPAQRAGLLNG